VEVEPQVSCTYGGEGKQDVDALPASELGLGGERYAISIIIWFGQSLLFVVCKGCAHDAHIVLLDLMVMGVLSSIAVDERKIFSPTRCGEEINELRFCFNTLALLAAWSMH
jgi:hypothetical protein